MNIIIKWLPRLEKQTEEMKNKIQSRIRKALFAGGKKIASDARRNAPWDRGYLRSSLQAVELEDVVLVGTNLFYGKFLEYGTGIYAEGGGGRKTPWLWEGKSVKWKGTHWTWGIKPRPFLRPAFEDNIETIKENVLKAASGE